MTTINTILKEYVVYLLEEYLKANPNGKTLPLYIDLVQYRERGLINGLVYPRTTTKGRIFVLNLYRNKIESHNKDKGITIPLLTYDQFVETRVEPEKEQV